MELVGALPSEGKTSRSAAVLFCEYLGEAGMIIPAKELISARRSFPARKKHSGGRLGNRPPLAPRLAAIEGGEAAFEPRSLPRPPPMSGLIGPLP
jgi:hypothetical protein